MSDIGKSTMKPFSIYYKTASLSPNLLAKKLPICESRSFSSFDPG